MTAGPLASTAPSRIRPQGGGQPGPDPGPALEAETLVELATAPAYAVAERARKALLGVLPNSALVLVCPGSPSVPVHIAAPPRLLQRLWAVGWTRMVGRITPAGSGVTRLALPGEVCGLHLAGWVVGSPGPAVSMVIGHHVPLSLTAGERDAAVRVAEHAAARLRAIDNARVVRALR